MKDQLKDSKDLEPFLNDETVIKSTTISLSRNVAGYKFLPKASISEMQDVLDSVSEKIHQEFGSTYEYYEPEFRDPFLGDIWAEQQITSNSFENKDCPRGLFVAKSNDVAIVINDINHLKLQIREKGLRPERCWSLINEIDDIVESRVEYAFSPQFGYLTTNLQDAGTGMKVSIEMHLPALAMQGKIGDLYDFSEAKDLDISGCRSDCDPEGDLFRISNNITIGRSEPEIVEEINKIAIKIAQFERQTRKLLVCEQHDTLVNSTLRALGLLKYSQMINFIEAANLLSKVKLGILTGTIENISIEEIDDTLRKIKPAKLNYDNCETLDYSKEEALRAKIIRKSLSSSS